MRSPSFFALAAGLVVACGAEPPTPNCPKNPGTTTLTTTPASGDPSLVGAGANPGPATVDEARKFFDQVDKDLHRLWAARDRASWVSENFITDDTEQLAADNEEA